MKINIAANEHISKLLIESEIKNKVVRKKIVRNEGEKKKDRNNSNEGKN